MAQKFEFTFLDEYLQKFQVLNIPPRDYFLKKALPLAVLALVVGIGMGVMVGILGLPAWAATIIPIAVIGMAGVGIYSYPLSQVDRKRMEIENALPFFMTHMGVLSTSNMPRTEVIRILAEREEYASLAEELRRIHSLVVDWKMALPEACRFVSQSSPSQIFSDFLERLAHAMETGQDMDVFMQGEQGVVMKEYATIYETAIYNVESWKDIYMSSIMSGAFLAIFAIITPILTGANPQNLLIGTLGFILFMEVLLAFVLRIRTPADRLWHKTKIETAERRRLKVVMQVSAAMSILLLVVLYLVGVPTGISYAIAVLPLIVPGRMALGMEEDIKRREDNYAAFVRSMGASLSSRGGSLREVLSSVKTHNFGPLTEIVNRLYSRLTWRIDDSKAWKYFAAESGSQLVDAFTDMFIEGVHSGGSADRVGGIISENVVRILNLRKARYSTAGTFRGTLYGLTASMAFVLFLGVGILGTLGDLFALTGSADIDTEVSAVDINFDFDINLVTDLVITLMVVHGLMAALMYKMVDGGSFQAGLQMAVVMTIVAVVLAAISGWVLPRVFSV